MMHIQSPLQEYKEMQNMEISNGGLAIYAVAG